MCCAVYQRIRVTLTPRSDQQIHLSSSTLGSCVIDLESFVVRAPFEFVLTAIDRCRAQIRSGFDLMITAEFASTMGLGSSSAVTVATVGVLAQWLGQTLSLQELFSEAKAVILQVQGLGSGADVAAAVFGGVIAYRTQPLLIQPFALQPDLVLVYSGVKVPTRTVINIVAEKQRAQPARYQQLFADIDTCAKQAVTALSAKNWRELGVLMNQHQDLQAALGVSTPLLDELTSDLRRQTGIYGAKISGSGLGDCVVGLGVAAENLFPLNASQHQAGVKQIPVKISPVGYRTEIPEMST
jgi:mevalonate kinase